MFRQFENDEKKEFDFYLQWEWPPHIEESLRRMLWVSLVEACEPGSAVIRHTALLRCQMATSPDTPPAVLDYLADFDETAILVRIAENPKTWTTTLTRLARHRLAQVRLAVAENTRLPLGIMRILVEDACPDVCYAMAENPQLPSSMLKELSASSNPYVAQRAARTLARRNSRAAEQIPLRYHHKIRLAE
jgi:hypothetical protein